MRRVLLAAGLVGILACESLLDTPAPPVESPSILDNPAFAKVMVDGAIADFECAYSNYVVATALLTDELHAITTLGGVLAWDRRKAFQSGGALGCVPDNSFGVGVYAPLSTARFQADEALRRIATFDSGVPPPGPTALRALAATYAGYSQLLMGEGFCEAAFDLGDALNWQEILARAEERFDTALALAAAAGAAGETTMTLARAGRARTRLSLGKRDSAAADAALIPDGFEHRVRYSTSSDRRRNRVSQFRNDVAVDTRFRDLRVDGVVDPRVPVVNGQQQLYVDDASPIVLASWREAQLIIAEAAGGQTAVDAINRVRTFWRLPLFASTDSAIIAEQVKTERTRELFLQGHRLNDMLRFGIPFDPVDHLGVPNGDLTCLRLPSVEIDNNPNITAGDRRTTRD